MTAANRSRCATLSIVPAIHHHIGIGGNSLAGIEVRATSLPGKYSGPVTQADGYVRGTEGAVPGLPGEGQWGTTEGLPCSLKDSGGAPLFFGEGLPPKVGVLGGSSLRRETV
jgi:hypothetical protein